MMFPATPWAISGTDRAVRDSEGQIVFRCEDLNANTSLKQLVWARRIVAAVNAVESIGTVALEDILRDGRQLELALLWATADAKEEAA